MHRRDNNNKKQQQQETARAWKVAQDTVWKVICQSQEAGRASGIAHSVLTDRLRRRLPEETPVAVIDKHLYELQDKHLVYAIWSRKEKHWRRVNYRPAHKPATPATLAIPISQACVICHRDDHKEAPNNAQLPVGRVINHDLEEKAVQCRLEEQERQLEEEKRRYRIEWEEQQRQRQARQEEAERKKQIKWDAQRKAERMILNDIDAAILDCFAPSKDEEEEDDYNYGYDTIEHIPATKLFNHNTPSLVHAVRYRAGVYYLYTTIRERAFALLKQGKLFKRRYDGNAYEWRCVPF